MRTGATDAARRRLVWAGPLALAAFYLRYGALASLGAIALAAAIVWRRQLRACAGPLAVATALAALGAVPHVWMATAATGSPLGMLREANRLAGQVYVGDGLVWYATAWWAWLGPAAAVAVAAGAVAAVTARRRGDEIAAMFGLAAAFALLVLGLSAHGEPRFALVPEVLLVAAGVRWLDARASAGRMRAPVAQVALVVALVIASIGTAWTTRRSRATFAVAVEAGAMVRAAAAGAPCRVWCGQWPQLEWYSGCRAEPVPAVLGPEEARGQAFVVWFARGRREDPAVLAPVLRGDGPVRAELLGTIAGDGGLWGDAAVYRLHVR